MQRYRLCAVFVLVVTVVLDRPVQAQTSAPEHTLVLHAARLLDIEDGRVLKAGEVLVKGDRIVEIGTTVKHPAGAAARTD